MKTTDKKKSLDMTPALRASARKIRGLMNENNSNDADAKYQIGAEVVAVKNDETKYGKGGVRNIARELGRSTVLLYSYAKVAETWKDDEFKKLIGQKNDKGLTLAFTHFIAIAKEDPEKRQAMLDEALAKSLTTRNVGEKTKAPNDSPLRNLGHRVAKVDGLLDRCEVEPASAELLAQLEQAAGQAAETKRALDAWMGKVDARIADMKRALTAPQSSENLGAVTVAAAE